MEREPQDGLVGVVLNEETALSLEELSQACAVKAEWVLALVDEGIIDAIGTDRAEGLAFPGTSLGRVRLAWRLHCDLELNLAGVALVLDLIREIHTLRAQRFEGNG